MSAKQTLKEHIDFLIYKKNIKRRGYVERKELEKEIELFKQELEAMG